MNVRLITATNRELRTQIEAGAFREDLYFRLNVIRLCIPPLRERTDDIILLVEHFIEFYCRQHRTGRPEILPAAMDLLLLHRWPGNIRELRNVVERVVLKANGRPIRPVDLPGDVFGPARALPVPVDAAAAPSAPAAPSQVDVLAARMLKNGESFWAVVYPVFMSRNLTRADLRKIITIGLESTNGNYRLLTQLFNMGDDDYKKFLNFLRKYDCHLPFQLFRVAPGRTAPSPRTKSAANI